MYTILDNTEMLTREEIDVRYDGKWVFLTNCEFTPGSGLIRGVPQLLADRQYEGVDDGVYDAYEDGGQFGETCGYNLLDFDYLIKSVTFLPKGTNNETSDIYI